MTVCNRRKTRRCTESDLQKSANWQAESPFCTQVQAAKWRTAKCQVFRQGGSLASTTGASAARLKSSAHRKAEGRKKKACRPEGRQAFLIRLCGDEACSLRVP